MESQGNTCNAVQIILLIIFFKLSCSYEIRRKHVCTFKQNHILETNAHFGRCAALIIRINSKVIWSFLAFFSLSLSHTQNDILGTNAFRKLMKRTNMKRRTLHIFFSLTENAMNEWMIRQTKQQKKILIDQLICCLLMLLLLQMFKCILKNAVSLSCVSREFWVPSLMFWANYFSEEEGKNNRKIIRG